MCGARTCVRVCVLCAASKRRNRRIGVDVYTHTRLFGRTAETCADAVSNYTVINIARYIRSRLCVCVSVCARKGSHVRAVQM